MAGDPSESELQPMAPMRFNPRPPSMAGDPGALYLLLVVAARFNPRPPSMAGDPAAHPPAQFGQHVSIRARHRWRAIQRFGFRC